MPTDVPTHAQAQAVRPDRIITVAVCRTCAGGDGARACAGHTATAVDDSFFVIGGTVNGIPDPSVWEFHISENFWTSYQLSGRTRIGP